MAFSDLTVKVAGSDLADQEIRVGGIRLEQTLVDHHHFEVECLALTQEDSDIDGGISDALDSLHDGLGQELELVATWDGSSSNQTLTFKGVITEVRHERQLRGAYTVILQGYSHCVRLDSAMRNRMWEEVKASDVIAEVCSAYGAVCDVQASTDKVYAFLVQHGQTDYDFLRELCSRELLHMYYDGTKLVVANQLDGGSQTLTMGRTEESGSLHSFGVSLAASGGKVRVREWDPVTAKSLKKANSEISVSGAKHPFTDLAMTRSDEVFGEVGDHMTAVPPASLADIDHELKNRKTSWLSHLVRGTGESDNLALVPGVTLDVQGVSSAHSGEYFVERVEHQFEVGGSRYRNEFECIPAQTKFPALAEPTPKQSSIWTGIVVDNYDPENAGHVKVTLTHSVDGETAEGASRDGEVITKWIPVASPHAGEGWGWVSLPEPGDEVLVAFIHGNFHRPVIIGSLHNPGKPSAAFDQITDEMPANEGKVFLTRSGNRLLFRDTPDSETIEISTPDQKNRITLTMDGGEKIEIHTEGDLKVKAMKTVTVEAEDSITVTSQKDITLEAQGDMNLKAKGKLNMEAKGNSELAGMEVNVKSKGGTVKASPSGVDVKGSMIKLN